MGDRHTAGTHQLLNVAQAQRETVIQPHRVPDDLDRMPVALVPRRNRHNDQSSQPPNKVNNLTMPSVALLPDDVPDVRSPARDMQMAAT